MAGDQPKNWRATSPRTDGRPGQELAGDQPKNWRATNPRTDGRPTQELADSTDWLRSPGGCAGLLAAPSWGCAGLLNALSLGLRRLAGCALLGAALACWPHPKRSRATRAAKTRRAAPPPLTKNEWKKLSKKRVGKGSLVHADGAPAYQNNPEGVL